MKVKISGNNVYVPDTASLEELAMIIEEYEEYTILITDELDENTDSEW